MGLQFLAKKVQNMSRYRSENKNIWRSNKPQTIEQPVTEVMNQGKIKKRGTKMNLSEIKPPQLIQSSSFIQKGQKSNFQTYTFLNKPNTSKKQAFKFEIKCTDNFCQTDDVMSVLSYGGYSVKSKFDKPNQLAHNHRKINKETTYDYLEDQIPYLQVLSEDQIEPTQNVASKNNLKKKKAWKKSPFAPLFYSKVQNLNIIERQTLHHQKRQKEIIQTHQKNLQKQTQKEKSRYTKNYSTYFGQRPLKQIKNPESGNHQIRKSQQSNNSKIEPNSALQKGKVQTRLQQRRQNNDDFQLSKPAQPTNKNCYPCRVKFDNYKEHIESNEHRLNVKKALGSSLFNQEMSNLENMKKKQINSLEYKMLEQFANYLQKLVDSNEQYILKKHQQLKIHTNQIYDDIERWSRL